MAKPNRSIRAESVQMMPGGDICSYENDNNSPFISHAPMPHVSAAPHPRRPLQPSPGNAAFNRSTGFALANNPPFKSMAPGYAAPLIPFKAMVPGTTIMHPQTDSMPKRAPLVSQSQFMISNENSGATGYLGCAHASKANPGFSAAHAPHPLPFVTTETHRQEAPGKRRLDAPPSKNNRPQKRQKSEGTTLAPHDSFLLHISDDGTKPGHSYATLIAMAILRSPRRRLTLSSIYKWISDHFKYYNLTDTGWQNSIRHNLSLNKSFIKQERPKDDPGKGNYWVIQPGDEISFLKEKPARKCLPAPEHTHILPTTAEPILPRPPQASCQIPTASIFPVPAPELAHTSVSASHFESVESNAGVELSVDFPTLQSLPEFAAAQHPAEGAVQAELPSSDATILASDNAAPDEPLEVTGVNDSGAYSPFPSAMHSSPPVPRHLEALGHTPPPMQSRRISSAAKSHKRKLASMDDSGYISSLDSSVLRSSHISRLPTSEADRPRRRNRAEDEIFRLRASSCESPTKSRYANTFTGQSSSPLRLGPGHEAGQMLPPGTPRVRLQPPLQPPPSVSPNTNLRLHRDRVRSMVDSPIRRLLQSPGDRWPRAGPLDQSTYDYSFGVGDGCDTSAEVSIFQDAPSPMFTAASHGSPIKRSAKKARMDRSHSTSVLGDITNFCPSRRPIASLPAKELVPFPLAPAWEARIKLAKDPSSSPSKPSAQSAAVLRDLDTENSWLGMDKLSSTNLLGDSSDLGQVDIMRGFDRIGQSGRNPPSTAKPCFGRSHTAIF